MKYLGKKRARVIISRLKDVIRDASMDGSQFSLSGGMGNQKDTEVIRKATHLWRTSWILSPLNDVLRDLENLYSKGGDCT